MSSLVSMPSSFDSESPVLVIVESPAKAKTIAGYLGSGYLVKASLGHVMDIPHDTMGYDPQNGFEPEWEIIKKKGKLVSELKALAKKSKSILLATDPDREGEAIASHLATLLSPARKKIMRVRFNEITKKVIQETFQSPTDLNQNLIEAQAGRRVLDRIVGYGMSPFLWKLKQGLSAGRVQSIPLRWICEREQEINSFVAEEYWSLQGEFLYKGFSFTAVLLPPSEERLKLDFIRKLFPDLPSKLDKKTKVALKSPLNFQISEIHSNPKKQFPPPPFITSSLQKAAQAKLGLSPSATMKILTTLYEGVSVDGKRKGLITYPRTDSTRVSDNARKMGYSYIKKKGWEAGGLSQGKSKGKIQDAHEAIRPTDIDLAPDKIKGSLGQKEALLYELIWKRFVGAFLAPAEFEVTTIKLQKEEFIFEAKWEVLLKPGFLELEGKTKQELKLPEWKVGDKSKLSGYSIEQKFTEPPPRYTEASLIDKMEKTGIGRPSTYAPTIEILFQRKYAIKKKKTIFPTDLGQSVMDILLSKFSTLLEDGFTREMEKSLDEIEEGIQNKAKFLGDFTHQFEIWKKQRPKQKEKTICPLCGSGHLEKKVTKKGKSYWICSKYPHCEFMEYINQPESKANHPPMEEESS